MQGNHLLNISGTVPTPEPFFNPRDIDTEWAQFSAATKKVPKNFDVPMIINGQKVYTKEKINDVNPSTGEVIGTCQQADESHAKSAIEAALAAKEAWASVPPRARMQKMRDLEAILQKWRYDICGTEAVECGYTSVETYVEWAELIDFIKFNNFYYDELLGEKLGDAETESSSLSLRPLKGFTCAVTPFNFPAAIGYHLPLAMALTGNTVVWKPSDDAALTSYLLMLALEEAGFPPGVINMISGDGKKCLSTVLTHPELSAVNFTGSFPTARAFGNYLYNTEYERPNFPRFCAETGGKNFVVIDADADVLDSARAIVQGAFGRSGQKCSASSIIFAHETIWPQLKKLVIQEAQALKVCNPLERTADVGPVINQRQFDKITGYIERAKSDKNCEVLVGGTSQGLYINPTVVEVSSSEHELLQEEVFGPLTAIRVYRDLSEVVSHIEKHNFRLTGSVISRNESFLANAVPMLSEYAGNFYVNRKSTGAVVHRQPFGGDASSGTNCKAGGKWYLLNFISQSSITRRHDRTTTPSAFDLLSME